MKISDLRHRITIQKKFFTKDPEGLPIEEWRDVVTVWAEILPLRGREFFEAAAVNKERTIKVRIRFRKGLDGDLRALYKDRILHIYSMIDVQEKHKMIEMMCEEVVS